jgi:ATP-dependent DNA ligase
LRPLPFEQRKARLAKLIRNSVIALCEHIEGDGAQVFCKKGLEGIVSKARTRGTWPARVRIG